MQTIRWLGFGSSSTTTKTLVHFYPSNGSVSAPYAAVCKLAVFGPGVKGDSVTLEGLRFSHPDGLRVDEAFPGLRDNPSGAFGLEIEIATNQPRMDLSTSLCIVELRSAGFSARYFPYQLPPRPLPGTAAEPEVPRLTGFAAIRDAYSTSSIVAVNTATTPIVPKLFSIDPECLVPGAEHEARCMIMTPPVDSTSVKEIEVPESFWERVPSREQSWGLVRARGLYLEHSQQSAVGYYAMTRDAKTKAPVSVSAL